MEIKAKSKYDWETIKKFNFFHSFKRIIAFPIIIIVAEVIGLFCFCLMCAWQQFNLDLIITYLPMLFANLIIVFTGFVLPKSQYKRNKLLHGVVNSFTFQQSEILIEQQGENTDSTAKINYEAVWRVYETKDFVYIYVNPRQAHIVDKDTIEGSTPLELRAFLIGQLGIKKYKLKCS